MLNTALFMSMSMPMCVFLSLLGGEVLSISYEKLLQEGGHWNRIVIG